MPNRIGYGVTYSKMLEVNRIHLGDCLEVMKSIDSGSIDMILCDLPYGTTSCKWDSVIPLKPLWVEYRRICKPSAAIVLTASQPFTSALVMSNISEFRYSYVWDHMVAPTGHLNAKRMPLRRTEDVVVFYRSQPTYNPQMGIGKPVSKVGGKNHNPGVYGSNKIVECKDVTSRYPIDLLEFKEGGYQTRKTSSNSKTRRIVRVLSQNI